MKQGLHALTCPKASDHAQACTCELAENYTCCPAGHVGAQGVPGKGLSNYDVAHEAFYWVWIDPSNRHVRLPPQLVVAQAYWSGIANTHDGHLGWEGCGTDEGVHVLSIVAKIDPPVGSTP